MCELKNREFKPSAKRESTAGCMRCYWWIEMHAEYPGFGSRLRVLQQSQYVSGDWSRVHIARFYGDGSGLLDQLLGTPELDRAFEDFLAANSCSKIEDFKGPYLDCLVDLHLRAKVDRARHAAALDGQPCFVRFGALPQGGRSWNHRDNSPEAGVSCYRAMKTPEKIYIYLSGTDQVSAAMIIGTKKMSLLHGEDAGIGSDGEPLLRNCTAEACSLPYEVISFQVNESCD